MLQIGSSNVGSVYVGGNPVSQIYVGSELVWEAARWDFVDDFNRSSIGADWSGSGAIIQNGTLKKNSSAGNSLYWTTRQFGSDDLDVEVKIGTTQDAQQFGVILIGNASQHVAVQFSKTRFNAFGFDGGWPGYGDFPVQPLADGDKVMVSRRGTAFTVYYNGNEIGRFSSSLARGTQYRRVGLEVRMAVNFFVQWYGPTFDAVKVREN